MEPIPRIRAWFFKQWQQAWTDYDNHPNQIAKTKKRKEYLKAIESADSIKELAEVVKVGKPLNKKVAKRKIGC